MLPALGANAWAGWALESTWGTKATSGFQYYEIAAGETLALKQVYYESPALNGAAKKGIIQGTKSFSGDLPCPMQYEGLELLLKHALGSVSTAASGSGYKHTFTPTDALMSGEGLTVEMNREQPTGNSFFGVGCKITKLAFAIEKDQILSCVASFHGKDVELASEGTPSFPTAPYILQTHLVVTDSGFTGTVDVLRATIEILNPVTEDRHDLASSGDLKEQQRSAKRSVNISVEGEFGEGTQYTDWTSDTEGQLIFTWTGPEYTTGENYELVMTANGKWTNRPPQVSDQGPVKLNGTFACFEDGSTPDIEIELTNEVSSIPS